MCVCVHVKRRERQIKAGDGGGCVCVLLNPCVGVEASPTQNALPHSSQPTQVFKEHHCLLSASAL